MNILTFDVEEWFHILDNKSTKTNKEWMNYESRIHQNMERIFELLHNGKTKATFFVLGWIAEKYPEIVREICDRGYEIGSHGSFHQLAYEQDREVFYQDVDRSIKTLEDISGEKIKMFRAPGFSISESNKYAFTVLHELGIEIDSSVFPATRAHGGMPNYGHQEPSILEYNGIQIKEFPINTRRIMGKPFIFSGGGYFRLYPYFLLNRWTTESKYIMSYFHPRDMDPGQPVIRDLSLARKFKSNVGLKSAENKLKMWIRDFDFVDIEFANESIDWKLVERIKI